MTYIETRALKLVDISQNPIKFYPRLIKRVKSFSGIAEDYVFFQTHPLALIRINKPSYVFYKEYKDLQHGLDFAILVVTCEEESLAKKVTEEITKKIRPLVKKIYDKDDYLKTIIKPTFFNLTPIKVLEEISNYEFESYQLNPNKFNEEIRNEVLRENFQQN